MLTPDQACAARDTFNNQADIIRSQISHRQFKTATELMFTLGGMVTMAESVDGWQTNLTADMRETYTKLWDELIAAQKADKRRTNLWEDAC